MDDLMTSESIRFYRDVTMFGPRQYAAVRELRGAFDQRFQDAIASNDLPDLGSVPGIFQLARRTAWGSGEEVFLALLLQLRQHFHAVGRDVLPWWIGVRPPGFSPRASSVLEGIYPAVLSLKDHLNVSDDHDHYNCPDDVSVLFALKFSPVIPVAVQRGAR